MSPFPILFENLLAQLEKSLAQLRRLVYLSLAAEHSEQPRIVVQLSGWAAEREGGAAIGVAQDDLSQVWLALDARGSGGGERRGDQRVAGVAIGSAGGGVSGRSALSAGSSVMMRSTR